MTVPRGSETLQLRLPANELKKVQAATPLTLPPSAAPALPTLPDSHPNLPFADRGNIRSNFYGAQLPSLSPFFLLSQQLSLSRWKIFRAALQRMGNRAGAQPNGKNQEARMEPRSAIH